MPDVDLTGTEPSDPPGVPEPDPLDDDDFTDEDD